MTSNATRCVLLLLRPFRRRRCVGRRVRVLCIARSHRRRVAQRRRSKARRRRASRTATTRIRTSSPTRNFAAPTAQRVCPPPALPIRSRRVNRYAMNAAVRCACGLQKSLTFMICPRKLDATDYSALVFLSARPNLSNFDDEDVFEYSSIRLWPAVTSLIIQ